MFKNKKNEDIIVAYASSSGNMQINWGIYNCGFGQINLFSDKERNVINIDNEMMSRDSIKAILCKMVDDAILTDFEESTKSITVLYDNTLPNNTLNEVNKLNICGKKQQLILPFYLDNLDNNNMVGRWSGIYNEEKCVYSIHINKIIDGISYFLDVNKNGFGNEVIKVEKWIFTTVKKQLNF